MTLVSVGVPTYARPVELAEAVRSVLDQGHADVEVVVGDDGAQGAAVVGAIGDPRVRYLRNEPRLGMAGNWNRVLDEARGAYVGLLMDDDRWLPGFLDACLPAFADPAVGVVFTDHVFDRAGVMTPRPRPASPGTHRDFTVEVVRDMPVAVSAALFRREVWQAVRPLPDTAAADVVLFARAAAAGWAFHYVDAPLMAYRVHPGQLSGGLAFRDECVTAWRSLEALSGAAEAARRVRLARALESRAAAYVRARRWADARRDYREARTLAPPPPRARLLAAVAAVAGRG